MTNFSLLILEYTDSDNLISCEQKWIDVLKPDYNLNPLAGNTKGYKHTTETIEKMRSRALGRKHSEETIKKKMSSSRYGREPTTGFKVEVTDITPNVTTMYKSVRQAAKGIGINVKTLSNYEKTQQEKGINSPYKNHFIIKFLINGSGGPRGGGKVSLLVCLGAGVGIGVVFGALILGVARNPSLRGQLFSYAILGFAFAEA